MSNDKLELEKESRSNSFFPQKSNPSNKAKYELAGGVICGLIGVALFFFEPYTATFLILCAFILLAAAIKHSREEPELIAAELV